MNALLAYAIIASPFILFVGFIAILIRSFAKGDFKTEDRLEVYTKLSQEYNLILATNEPESLLPVSMGMRMVEPGGLYPFRTLIGTVRGKNVLIEDIFTVPMIIFPLPYNLEKLGKLRYATYATVDGIKQIIGQPSVSILLFTSSFAKYDQIKSFLDSL
jgi:hypothetical protein